MRFVRREEIITTLCDKTIEDETSIAKLLTNLKKENLYFGLTVSRQSTYDRFCCSKSYDRTRVENVGNGVVDFLVDKGNSVFILRGIMFSDVVEIFALTKKAGLIEQAKLKESWDYLDIEGEKKDE